jgi:hypothetical protein
MRLPIMQFFPILQSICPLRYKYQVWLLSSWDDFTAHIPVYLKLNEWGHLQSNPLEQLYTQYSDVAPAGNIHETLF